MKYLGFLLILCGCGKIEDALEMDPHNKCADEPVCVVQCGTDNRAILDMPAGKAYELCGGT